MYSFEYNNVISWDEFNVTSIYKWFSMKYYILEPTEKDLNSQLFSVQSHISDIVFNIILKCYSGQKTINRTPPPERQGCSKYPLIVPGTISKSVINTRDLSYIFVPCISAPHPRLFCPSWNFTPSVRLLSLRGDCISPPSTENGREVSRGRRNGWKFIDSYICVPDHTYPLYLYIYME